MLQGVPFGTYRISRLPGVGVFSGCDIMDKLGTGLFESALTTFLTAEAHRPLPPLNILDCFYPLYKEFLHTLGSLRVIANDTHNDCIRATPSEMQSLAQFDTVLFVHDKAVASNVGPQGVSPFCEMQLLHY